MLLNNLAHTREQLDKLANDMEEHLDSIASGRWLFRGHKNKIFIQLLKLDLNFNQKIFLFKKFPAKIEFVDENSRKMHKK